MFIEVFRFNGVCVVTVECDSITTVVKKTKSIVSAIKFAKRKGEELEIPVHIGIQ